MFTRRWARATADTEGRTVRSVLEPVIRLIRFPLIPIDRFATDVAVKGLLTPEECISVFLHHSWPVHQRLVVLVGDFITLTRKMHLFSATEFLEMFS
jgi:hypothetical protein